MPSRSELCAKSGGRVPMLRSKHYAARKAEAGLQILQFLRPRTEEQFKSDGTGVGRLAERDQIGHARFEGGVSL
jgi:hypothetical protein